LKISAYVFVVILFLSLVCTAQVNEADQQLALDIFKQLIEINTTDSVGNVTTAAEAMARRFRDAGFSESDMQVIGPNEKKKNLVLHFHGTGKRKPVLLIGHLDVVEARREDWTTDPFQFVEKDGYYYGRGTQDMKDGDAIMVETLIQLKKEGFVPDRDITLALTANEEGGAFNGVEWLVKNHRDLIDAEFVLNHDGGGIDSVNGKPETVTIDAAEKLYADFQFSVTNSGGHSSRPVPDNAIYHLADALARLEKYKFPAELNNVTRGYYEQEAKIESGQRAADMQAILKTPLDEAAAARLSRDTQDNAILHTTCVATRLNGGHANNALPQLAQAVVNCRILPGHSAAEVQKTLNDILADPKVVIKYIGAIGGVMDHASDTQSYAPPPLNPEVMEPLIEIAKKMWPRAPVVPDMATGASDAVYTMPAGLPTYGVSGVAIDKDDVRMHGKDERLRIESFRQGVNFYYQYLKAVASE
jgi:acetylornithine deacetylase/succinyl-diaminopimelate desuccinylase-like protein